MTPEIKKKWDALKYRMEKESYLLILLELRFASLEHAITMSFGHREVAMALGLSDRYIRLMKQIRDTTEGTIEDYALSMLEYIYEENGDDKRNFTHFRLFDTDALDRWWKNKRREEELDVLEISKESLISDFKHDFWRKFKTDIEITQLAAENERDPEEPKETKVEEDEDDTKEMMKELNERVSQDEIVCRMFREGAISEETAIKYVGGDLDHNSFMKLVKICTDEEKTEVDVDFWCETQKKEHQMELVANMVASGAIMPEVAFEYMNKDNDFHDYDNFLRILDVWIEKEEKQHDDSDD